MSRSLCRTLTVLCCATLGAQLHAADSRQAYFGDLHIHTRYSFDAFAFGTKTGPDDAYRFAKGAAIPHSGGFDIQLERPLDFYAVTDHGMYMGMWWAMTDPEHRLHDDPEAQRYYDPKTKADRSRSFRGSAYLRANPDPAATRTAWQDTVEAADRHYRPGEFTTFAAYEYTTSRNSGNLHRNVIFRGAAADLPFSRLDSLNPEDLWDWMDGLRDDGIEAVAIPHNANGSDGRMFEMMQFDGSPIDRTYAEQRMRNEPLVEVTQIKGTSDTHPALSPNDEWADFEIYPYRIATMLYSQPHGSYARQALLRGLELEADKKGNPYRFGLIGASDTHNSGDVLDEDRFVSKVGVLTDEPVERGSVPVAVVDGNTGYTTGSSKYHSASGLTGVWADTNTRDAIFDAFRRKETFATSGPRIKVRFFAGYGLDDKGDDPVAAAYENGVPMGGDLSAKPRGEPEFMVSAMQDPSGTKLQRLQVIKGWLDDGHPQERVYDVACSDGGKVDPETHRCPDNGASVELSDCSITADVGSAELEALWRDPDFDSGQRAFYYVRALENPTCRWSTWDAVRAGTPPNPSLAATIQERAWSSPIWVVPR